MSWVVVRNWERFQHYGPDRKPTWIKLYTELNSDDDWLGLSTAARGMLATIWLEYARSGGQLRVEKCMQLCGKSARTRHLVSLKEAGFIEIVASKPSRARATLAREEKEKDPPTPHRGAASNHRKPKTTGWRLVRGSHGQTHVPDPNGTDRPPPEVRT